jgi:phosphate uptake regulator
MAFKLFGGGSGDVLESVEAKVQAMLAHDRYEIDLAMAALLGDRVASEINDDLRTTDQKVNRLEREIRRELMVRTSVLGAIDTPAVLVYMSIVKDIERIGDYAKNLIDLARDGANFADVPDAAEWRRLWTDITTYLAEAGEAFRARDGARCRALLARGDRMLHMCDDRVSALVRGDDCEPQAVARSLAFRYIKRVIAHAMNMLSAVVMPLDRLDYFSEDPEDRSAR